MSRNAPAVENAIEIINAIANSSQPIGVSEISRVTNINKNMIFRVLNSLEECGWVFCDNEQEKKYRLSLVPFKTVSKALDGMSLSTASALSLYKLWEKTKESTYLAILKGDIITYIQHLDSVKDVRVAGRLGGEYELYCSAPGKVLLAYSDEKFIFEYVKKDLLKRTKNSITDPNLLLEELKAVRKNGYATDKEEFGNGICCAAAPVFDYKGNCIAAVGCSAFTLDGQCDNVIANFKDDVIVAAKEISVNLGSDK